MRRERADVVRYVPGVVSARPHRGQPDRFERRRPSREHCVSASMATPAGFPEEFAPLIAAQHERHIWQPQHLGEDVREIVRGGNPDRSPSMERRDGGRWEFTLAKEFRRDLKQRSHLFEQSIAALMEVCDSPMSARSNTVKPLRNELRGMWRYRMGDLRLIYQPDKDRRVVHFLGLKPRADAYE